MKIQIIKVKNYLILIKNQICLVILNCKNKIMSMNKGKQIKLITKKILIY